MNQRVEEIMKNLRRIHKIDFAIMFPEISQGEYYLLATIDHIYEVNKESDPESKKTVCKMRWQMVGGERMLRLGVSYLAGMMEVTPPAVSRMVGALADKGYAKRIVDEQDRRNICIGLTEKGHDLCRQIRARMDELAEKVFQIVGFEEIDHFCRTLAKMQEVLQAEFLKYAGERNIKSQEGDKDA